jgi:hypothetical protein
LESGSVISAMIRAMKIPSRYFLFMLGLALMVFSHALFPDELNDHIAVIVEEASESKIVAIDSNGDVDDLLNSHCPLPTRLYLGHANILLQHSYINIFALPIRARAPPIA